MNTNSKTNSKARRVIRYKIIRGTGDKYVRDVRDDWANQQCIDGIYGTYLGGGCFADVYASEHDGERVFKITKWYDGAYLAYARYAYRLRNPSPYLPRVYSITMYTVMDEYARMRAHGYSKTLARKRASFIVFELERLKPYGDLSHPLQETIEREHLRYGDSSGIIQSACLLGSLAYDRALRQLDAVLHWAIDRKRKSRQRDMHAGNFMWRVVDESTKQLVFTDPICGDE